MPYVITGQVAVVDVLIRFRAKVDSIDKIDPIVVAVQKGHVAVVKSLIRAGAKLDHIGLLATAVQLEFTEIVQALLMAGANPDVLDKAGWSPLCRAAMSGNKVVVQALVSAEADLEMSIHQGTPLELACKFERLEVFHISISLPFCSVF